MERACVQFEPLELHNISKFVQHVCRIVKPGDWIFLDGDLGAGKTTLVQALAKYLGVSENVTSPTFSLMNVYPGLQNALHILKLVHLDLYRLKKGNELFYIGLEQEFSANALVLIEWPTQVENEDWHQFFETTGCRLPSARHYIFIEIDENRRRYRLKSEITD